MDTKIVKIEGNKIQVVVDNNIEEYELEPWVKPEFVKLGDADITVKDGKVSFVLMTSSEEKTESKKSEKEYMVNISGKDFMTYEGLLKKAHEKKENFSMVITDSWVSEDMKMAWCKVRLTTSRTDGKLDQTFDGFGSSTPENTGDMTQSHPVEMSHTRAKGRALRDYLNIGQVMAEELKQGK